MAPPPPVNGKGNIKDLLNGEPFTARIVNGMVESLAATYRASVPFLLRHGVIRHKRRDFRDQNIIIKLFQHLQPLLADFL